MSQLMPLPLTVSCFSKIQIGFTFLVPAHLGSPGKWPLNGCVCDISIITEFFFWHFMLGLVSDEKLLGLWSWIFTDCGTSNVKVLLLLLHKYNSLFSTTVWVSQYQKGKTSLDLNEARGDMVLECNANNLCLAPDR